MKNATLTSHGVKILSMLILATLFTMTFSVRAVISPVAWVGEDTLTQGDWLHPKANPLGDCQYGKYAHILPNAPRIEKQIPIGNFTVPIGGYVDLPNPPFNWDPEQVEGVDKWKAEPPYYDEFVSQLQGFCYYVNGTRIYPGTPPYIQYPVFEYAWDVWHVSQTDPREVYFTTSIPDTGNGPGWRLTCWDDGGERCQPEHGYFNVTLCFPGGTYFLSLYAYDYERDQRASQEYRIYDSTGTMLLASKQISGSTFDEGVYEIFRVNSPTGGSKIIVQVYNDAGHVPWEEEYPVDKSLNVLLSGIFVDKIAPVGGELEIPTGLGAITSWIGIASAVMVPASLVAYTLYRKKK
jgi:hypothetical protein